VSGGGGGGCFRACPKPEEIYLFFILQNISHTTNSKK
jgi:hypothetical protein